MKLTIQVNEGPYQHQSADSAYFFAKAALEKGHEIYRIFGLVPQAFRATYDAFLNSVHPDDSLHDSPHDRYRHCRQIFFGVSLNRGPRFLHYTGMKQ